MTFPFRRKTEFYSSKTKSQVLELINQMIENERFAEAGAETVTGDFVIQTTDRLLLFDIVFAGEIYEFDGKTKIIVYAKMRLLVEVLLLLGGFTVASSLLFLFSEDLLFNVMLLGGLLLLCGTFWAINYFQFKPALNSIREKLS